MGIRGLTSYIAQHADQYLTPYELHDCNLVIDGDNLACNLYKDVCGAYSAFGGDYDDYYRAVLEFFHVLGECNIRPYVLMDGGYEQRKLRTVGTRMRGKIAAIKRINPCGSAPVFPIMMKEVFVEAAKECDVPVMRCVFEADDELATLSRKLNCPVLSYDSDFYIHNVRYIPLVTLTLKAHTKVVKDEAKEQGNSRRLLRKSEAKHLQKRSKASRIVSEITVDHQDKKSRANKGVHRRSYKYLDCCMYRIENLIDRKSLSKEKLPLFAALLGNDYIARSSFKNFFRFGLGKGGRSRKMKQQQRRIRLILQWLKMESAETALEKILSRLKMCQRDSLRAQVNSAICGYSNELCHSYDFFKGHYEGAFSEFIEDQEENEESEEDESGDNDQGNNAKHVMKQNSSDTDTASENGEEDEGEEEEEQDDLEEEEEYSSEEEDDVEDKTKQFPPWFLEKLYPAHLPRFFVDLWHLRKYMNSPQIEHFPYNDCHEIALPILIYNFTLLMNAVTDDNKCRAQHTPPEFTYMTRVTRNTNVRYERCMAEQAPEVPFVPQEPDPQLFREVFRRNLKNFPVDDFFDSDLPRLPSDLQLYMAAIVYWLYKSPHCDVRHLHALLICLVVLRTIDAKVPPARDLREFQKCYGKIVRKERAFREQQGKRQIKDELRTLPITERIEFISKSDCLLVMDNLIKHFHMPDIFKKKYDLYSSIVLHSFAEFQSVLFQLMSLNALLDYPICNAQVGHLYCGTFIYNMYDLLQARLDIRYYVQNFIFQESPNFMFELYDFLWQWCESHLPQRMKEGTAQNSQANKKMLKKQRQKERKLKEKQLAQNLIADMLEKSDKANEKPLGEDQDEFYDLNNKFCAFLKIGA